MDKAIEKAWKNLGPSRFCLFVEWLTFYSIIFIVGLVLLVGIYLIVIAGYLKGTVKNAVAISGGIAIVTSIMTAWITSYLDRQYKSNMAVRGQRRAYNARRKTAGYEDRITRFCAHLPHFRRKHN